MSTVCRVVLGDHASVYPPVLDRKTPGETIVIEHDLSDDADCQGQGLTVTVNTWEVHPDDTDGAPTLSNPAFSGLITSVRAAAGSVGTYRLLNTVTLSDGQVLERTSQCVIAETVKVGL